MTINFVIILLLCSTALIGQVLSQTDPSLNSISDAIKAECSDPNYSGKTLDIVAALIGLTANTLSLHDLQPNTDCTQIILNVILRFLNAVQELTSCWANVLLTTLHTNTNPLLSPSCCDLLTDLANIALEVLIKLLLHSRRILNALGEQNGASHPVILGAFHDLIEDFWNAIASMAKLLKTALELYGDRRQCACDLLTNLANYRCTSTFIVATHRLLVHARNADNACATANQCPSHSHSTTVPGAVIQLLQSLIARMTDLLSEHSESLGTVSEYIGQSVSFASLCLAYFN